MLNDSEPLINLAGKKIAYGTSPEIDNNNDYTKVRQRIYDMLVVAQDLLPDGLKLCLYEGYRSLKLQQYIFDKFYNTIKSSRPDLTHNQLFEETARLVSPVMNPDGTKNIPPHSTGAAVDIYLIDDNKQIIDMGLKVKDWQYDHEGILAETNSTKISSNAKKYREIMSLALSEAGFVNYFAEYWHWSYGDKYWAYITGSEYAIYDSI